MLNRIRLLAALVAVACSTVACGADAPATAATTPAAGATTPPAAGATATPAATGDQAAIAQYALGYQLGRELAGAEDRSQSMLEGLRDGRAGTPAKYSEPEMQAAMQKLGQQVSEQRAKLAAKDAETQNAASKKFLTDNAAKPGVKTTASGLQYKVVSEGTGKQPAANDTVTVNYRGTLLDGTEFDSSYKRGEPATFPVNGVIAGWTEALQLMKEGAKYQLFIPANLAYAERGPLANRLLIFDVELIKVGPPAPAEAPK
jgi:FKBP-type peptidyl-prolyl cis-trans isomerase FklB